MIEFKNTNPSYDGKEFACIHFFDGFRKVKMIGDGSTIANLDMMDSVSFHCVYEDGTIDITKRSCKRHELYGIKK